MTYARAESFLHALPQFALAGEAAYEPGLARITSILSAMGDPHQDYPIVHIAGTNGKGSTASFLSAIMTAAGMKTGLHTSPHLHHLAERLRINGRPAPEAWIAGAVGQYQDVFEREKASFFEALVALSLLYFSQKSVDLAIVEVGLGGRLDATNIVSPDLVLFTSIARDHTQILGNSFRDIAREKAGIIKAGIPVISAVRIPEAVEEIKSAAVRLGAPYVSIDGAAQWDVLQNAAAGSTLKVLTEVRDYGALQVALPGAFQHRNAILALLAAEKLLMGMEGVENSIRAGLEQVAGLSGIRGRMEVVQQEPLVVLDVGHNSEGLKAALIAMSEMLAERRGRLFVLFGTMRDKDIEEMARQLSDNRVRVFATSVYPENTQSLRGDFSRDYPKRALPPGELAQFLRYFNVDVVQVRDLEQGLLQFDEEAMPGDGLLITGSHFLVARFRESNVL